MVKSPAGSGRHRSLFADLYALITTSRRRIGDALVPSIPLSADDVARIRGWACFLGALALLYHNLPLAWWMVLLALILDSVDGAVARRQGLDCPQSDRAMDMFTEFLLSAAYLAGYPGLASTILMGLWVVPKTLWIAHYLKRRFGPSAQPRRTSIWHCLESVLVPLHSLPFSHILLVVVFVKWVLKWNLP